MLKEKNMAKETPGAENAENKNGKDTGRSVCSMCMSGEIQMNCEVCKRLDEPERREEKL